MAVWLNTYATSSVTTTEFTNATSAVYSDLDSQVNFDIHSQEQSRSYPSSRVDCNDAEATVLDFEDWLHSNGELQADEHFMLVADCDFSGYAYYLVGENGLQNYQPSEYGLSVVGVDNSASLYENMAIHEFCHTLMTDSDCPDASGAADEHSCGKIQFGDHDVSPMLTTYVSEAEQNDWTICSGDPTAYDGGKTKDCSTCTLDTIEDWVSNHGL